MQKENMTKIQRKNKCLKKEYRENLEATREYQRKKYHENKKSLTHVERFLQKIRQVFHLHCVSSLSLSEKCKTSSSCKM